MTLPMPLQALEELAMCRFPLALGCCCLHEHIAKLPTLVSGLYCVERVYEDINREGCNCTCLE